MKTRTLINTLLVVASASLSAVAVAAGGTGTTTQVDTNVPPVLTNVNDPSSPNFLKKFVDFMTQKPNGDGNYQINYTLNTLAGSGLASYAEGSLQYNPAKLMIVNNKLVTIPATLATAANGPKNQLFNDRRYALTNSPFAPTFPFDPTVADNLGISIAPDTGKVTLTLKSWGNKQITFDTVADPMTGVIYGFAQASAGKPRQMVVISLQKLFFPIPR
jgi:hypothetical protein